MSALYAAPSRALPVVRPVSLTHPRLPMHPSSAPLAARLEGRRPGLPTPAPEWYENGANANAAAPAPVPGLPDIASRGEALLGGRANTLMRLEDACRRLGAPLTPHPLDGPSQQAPETMLARLWDQREGEARQLAWLERLVGALEQVV